MEKVVLRVRRPHGAEDALTPVLAEEVEVYIFPGGVILAPQMGPVAHEDVVFLQNVIDALREEVLRLEEKLRCRAPRVPSRRRKKRTPGRPRSAR